MCLLVLGIGLAIGLLNGMLVRSAKIDSFIATLGVGTVACGLAGWYTGAEQIIGDIPHGLTALDSTRLLGVPLPAVLLLVLVSVMWVAFEFLPIGRYLYVIGANGRPRCRCVHARHPAHLVADAAVVFFGDYDAARALARDCNEYQARMVADHKGRFGMFTLLPLPDIDNTLAEIAYGMDTLKAQGVGMMTSYGAKYLGDPAFTPVMQELDRRHAVVFVHPLQPACCTNVVPGVPDVVVEYGTETSRTIASLLMNTRQFAFPNIRFIFAHGVAPCRSSLPLPAHGRRGQAADDGGARRCGGIDPETVFDTTQAWNQYTLPALTKLMPADHILFGSDFPAASPLDTVNGLQAFGLDDAARLQIERRNARAILANMTGFAP